MIITYNTEIRTIDWIIDEIGMLQTRPAMYILPLPGDWLGREAVYNWTAAIAYIHGMESTSHMMRVKTSNVATCLRDAKGARGWTMMNTSFTHQALARKWSNEKIFNEACSLHTVKWDLYLSRLKSGIYSLNKRE